MCFDDEDSPDTWLLWVPLRCESDFELLRFGELRAGGDEELGVCLSFLSPEQLDKLNKPTIEMIDSRAFIAYILANLYSFEFILQYFWSQWESLLFKTLTYTVR